MSIASTFSWQQCFAENPGIRLSRPGPGGSWCDESSRVYSSAPTRGLASASAAGAEIHHLRQLNQNSMQGAYNRCHSRSLDWNGTTLMDVAEIMAPAYNRASGWCACVCRAMVVCHDSVSVRRVGSRNARRNRYLSSVGLT